MLAPLLILVLTSFARADVACIAAPCPSGAFHAQGLATKVVATPAPTPKAEFVDFQDVQGDLRSRVPDGKLDYHFRLTALQRRRIAFIDVKAGSDSAGTGFKWSNVAGEESPKHPEGKWWLITYAPKLTEVSDTRDIWFSNPYPDKPYTSFRVYVVYDERNIEDRDAAVVDAPLAPRPEPEPEPDDLDDLRLFAS